MADGKVRFSGALIDGHLECMGGTFKNAGGLALDCDDVKMTIDVILGDSFTAEGEVSFAGAEIGGLPNCEKGIFKNAGGIALRCSNAKVTEDVYLRNGFKADGEVRFSGADIGGDFCCTGGSFKNARATPPDDALSLFGAKINGTLRIGSGASPNNQPVTIEGSLNLQGARAARFVDDPNSSPIEGTGHIRLDGFTYERLFEGTSTDASLRMEWLSRQSDSHLRHNLRTQPFEQLARVLRDMGHDAEAVASLCSRNRGFVRRAPSKPVRGIALSYGLPGGRGSFLRLRLSPPSFVCCSPRAVVQLRPDLSSRRRKRGVCTRRCSVAVQRNARPCLSCQLAALQIVTLKARD